MLTELLELLELLAAVCSGSSLASAGAPTSSSSTTTQNGGSHATSTPAETPEDTATATHPLVWTTIKTFKGNSTSKTEPFTLDKSQWRIAWSCNPATYGSSYNLIADLTVPGDVLGDNVVNVICSTHDPSTRASTTMEYASGTFYLDITSEASWTFLVQVMQ